MNGLQACRVSALFRFGRRLGMMDALGAGLSLDDANEAGTRIFPLKTLGSNQKYGVSLRKPRNLGQFARIFTPHSNCHLSPVHEGYTRPELVSVPERPTLPLPGRRSGGPAHPHGCTNTTATTHGSFTVGTGTTAPSTTYRESSSSPRRRPALPSNPQRKRTRSARRRGSASTKSGESNFKVCALARK